MISLHPIFFEEYRKSDFKTKHGQLESILAPAFLMKNKYLARSWANAIVSSCLKVPSNFKKLVIYWNDFKNILLPYIFGGWITIYEDGLANLFDCFSFRPDLIKYAKASNYLMTNASCKPKVVGDLYPFELYGFR